MGRSAEGEPLPKDFDRHQRVQRAARGVLDGIPKHITSESTEASIAQTCVELLAQRGIAETWYYATPAFVLLGNRSCLSISGRDYVPAAEPVGETNLVTIDLSPVLGSAWGDLARSFPVESGVVVTAPQDAELREGMEAETLLHDRFRAAVRIEMTFEEVFSAMNDEIAKVGFMNLDFMGNVGHTIVERREDRVYFERGNQRRLGEVEYFTFEPHIRRLRGVWGFKHENIYYFDDSNRVCEL